MRGADVEVQNVSEVEVGITLRMTVMEWTEFLDDMEKSSVAPQVFKHLDKALDIVKDHLDPFGTDHLFHDPVAVEDDPA